MISDASKRSIVERWQERPDGISYPPATKAELDDFESIHSRIPDDFRWFLECCGSGVLGSEWINGIDDLYASHTKFDAECQLPNGWKTREMFIMSVVSAILPLAVA